MKKIKLATHEELKKSDVIVALSFGRRIKNPGLSNNNLGVIVSSLYHRFKLPLILQWEIADSLSNNNDIKEEKVIREHRRGEFAYLDTFEVLDQAKEFCETKDWIKIVLVAHQAHLPRAKRVAERLGFIVNIPFIKDVPYDKESIQKWTRSKYRFAIREKLATIAYSREGKI